ncbi:unnamed protein product [Adineta steineri]|uniref:Uncharacterized protein n=1 Tax=Adineta steineri TaxID=433720 RepID=A0A818WLN9_9BILA|nr:unnamed protein product [Adineta steineri]
MHKFIIRVLKRLQVQVPSTLPQVQVQVPSILLQVQVQVPSILLQVQVQVPSREFFYWSLKRRLGEDNAVKTLLTADSLLDYHKALNYLQQWFNEDKKDNSLQWTNDKEVVQWLDEFNESSLINDRITNLQKENARQKIYRLLEIHPDLLSDINEHSNDEQRQAINRNLNSKTKN